MVSKKNIKAVLFDLDGTLRFSLPAAGEIFIEHIRSLDVQISEEERIMNERWEYQYFASSLEVQADYVTYKNDLKSFWVNFTKRRLLALGLHPDKAHELAPKVSHHMDAFYKPQSYVPDEVFALLKHLQESNYVLGVVSNRDVSFQEELENLKLNTYFQFAVAAGEVKSYKPEPVIFQHALELSKTSPAETMYVGDNYYADIVGSLQAGLIPVLYDPNNLFPEAGAQCAVIKHYSEFYELLK